MVIKTILIFLIALLGYSEWLTGTSYLQRPLCSDRWSALSWAMW